jgi:hypothetical protein
MNFHYELRKSSCRRPLKILTQWTLRVLEVRRHELVIGRSPTWAPCRIRYYPSVRGPAGQYIGWTDTLAAAIELLAYADTSQVLPGNGLLNGKEPMQ